MIKCGICGKDFPCHSALSVHSVVHTGIRRHPCLLCEDTSFTQESSYRRHLFVFHSPEPPYTCDTCGRRFNGKATLKKHELTHAGLKRFVCDVCDRSFLRIDYLKEHKRIHAGIKPYRCPVEICGKTFSRSHACREHMNTHTGARPHKCDVCGVDFATRTHLTRHFKNKHC